MDSFFSLLTSFMMIAFLMFLMTVPFIIIFRTIGMIGKSVRKNIMRITKT